MTMTKLNVASEFEQNKHYQFGRTAEVLSSVYNEEVNLSVWKRSFSAEESLTLRNVLTVENNISVRTITSVDKVNELIKDQGKGLSELSWFCDDITMLVDMYCYLFDVKEVGIRLQRLSHAMCPKFHVDKLPCRLVTTYQGPSTQWLNNEDVTRTHQDVKGQPRQQLRFPENANINELSVGDVALLKGDGWYGNEIGGVVHRSPSVEGTHPRLFLSLDAVGQ